MKRKLFGGLLVVGALLLSAMPALAHHSSAAEFDGNKEAVVKGVLTKVLWSNPHIYFFMNVTQPDGKVVEYSFQSGVPLLLHKAGLSKEDFKLGEEVTVTYAPAKDGKNYGWMKMIKWPDGHVFVYRVGSE